MSFWTVVGPYWDEVLTAGFFVCVFCAAWQLAASLGRIGRLPEQVRPPRWEGLAARWPELTGMLIGGLTLTHNPLWAAGGAMIGAALGHYLKGLMRWLGKRLAEGQLAGEVLMLYELVAVYCAAGYTLRDALAAGLHLVSASRAALRTCLLSWSQGADRALARFGEELGIPEGRVLCDILRQALMVGPGRMAEFLSQESTTMERLRQYRVEQGLTVRPLLQALYLALPGLALMGVTLLPIGYHAARSIMRLKLS